MTEQDIKSLFGKSIWSMTPSEIVENNLVDVWVRLVDEAADDAAENIE